jgi:putative phosphoribosyl transferase
MTDSQIRFQLPFRDRVQAGRVLASVLRGFTGRRDVIVLGLPRGGVIVAAEVAQTLGLPLDVFIVRKLGVPGHEELAMGAIASGGSAVLNQNLIRRLGIPKTAVDTVIDREYLELKRREELYRSGKDMPDISDKTALVIDDGIATGASIVSTIQALRKLGAARIVIATPVVTADVAHALRYEADELISAVEPEDLDGIGLWYEDFHQTSDEEVLDALTSVRPAPENRQPDPARSEVA